MGNSWRTFSIGNQKIKIDSEDFDRISKHTWRIRRRDDTKKLSIMTSVRTPDGVRNLSLGKFLMNPPKGKLVYARRFIDGFDYRKENLIVCSIQERQTMIPKRRKDTSSKYRGVSYLKTAELWRAGITVNGSSMNLGDFKSEEAAARAYNTAAKKYFGENGYQNTIARRKSPRS